MISCNWFFRSALLTSLIGFLDVQFVLATDPGPKHGKVVVCYIGTWSVYRPTKGSFSINSIDPTLCTHLIYSFAGLDEAEDSITSLDPWQDLEENFGKGGYIKMTQLKNEYPHLKVSIAIGGWNEGSANYSALVKDPSRRGRFVANAVKFIKKYNFDGLDLDWEFPGKRGGVPEDKTNFLRLVKELRSAFNKFNFLLTAALGAGQDTIDIAYDVKGLSTYLDYIHMMCYDYHGAWDHMTGANAPLRGNDNLNVEYTIEYMLKLGAPAKKLVMGIPLYGRTFQLKTKKMRGRPRMGDPAEAGRKGHFTGEAGFMGYNEICLEIQNTTSGWQTFWDEHSVTPYAVNGLEFVAYDDLKSIAAKVEFAMKKGLAGIMVWSLDTDDFQGDCSQLHTDSDELVNFPLLRQINSVTEKTLHELKNLKKLYNVDDEDNTIIHGHAEHTGSSESVKQFVVTVLIAQIVLKFL